MRKLLEKKLIIAFSIFFLINAISILIAFRANSLMEQVTRGTVALLNHENLLIAHLVRGDDLSTAVSMVQTNINGINSLNPRVDLWSLIGLIYNILLLPFNIFLSIYISKIIESKFS